MSVPPVSPVPSTGAPIVQAISFSAVSFAEKMAMLGSQLYETAKEQVISHPYIILATATAVTVGYFLYKHLAAEPSLSLDKLASECESLCKKNKEAEASQKIKNYAKEFIKNRNNPIISNEKNVEYFSNKLSKILIDSDISLDSKILIISQVQKDFIQFLDQTKNRAINDLNSDHLKELNITKNDQLASIECLGNETHNEGKIPTLLIFKSGKKIVYKPRSMIPEQLICGKKDSVFSAAELGTYTVVCRKDEKGDYGYCECLYNRQEENTMSSSEEVEDYFKQLILMEKVCKEIGLSDIHFDNIITDHKIAFFIDAESFLNPKNTPVGIFQTLGAGNTFNPTGLKENQGKNKIWFSEQLTQGKKVSFSRKMQQEDLKTIGVNLEKLTPELNVETKKQIEKAKDILKRSAGRFVLIDTLTLRTMLIRTDPQNPAHLNIFVSLMEERLGYQGFSLDKDSNEQIKEAFKKNVLHNDVPIFYYDSKVDMVFYEGIPVGKRQTK